MQNRKCFTSEVHTEPWMANCTVQYHIENCCIPSAGWVQRDAVCYYLPGKITCSPQTMTVVVFLLVCSRITYILTKSDCLEARPGEEYFSTKARVLKPNLWIGSLESNGGKSVSTSPSSSAMWRQ